MLDVGWLRFIAAAVKQSRAMPVVGRGEDWEDRRGKGGTRGEGKRGRWGKGQEMGKEVVRCKSGR